MLRIKYVKPHQLSLIQRTVNLHFGHRRALRIYNESCSIPEDADKQVATIYAIKASRKRGPPELAIADTRTDTSPTKAFLDQFVNGAAGWSETGIGGILSGYYRAKKNNWGLFD